MALEVLVGLQIIDKELYQKYRDHMLPLLVDVGGGFNYDFEISEVLRAKTEAPINRVFTIYFPNKNVMDAFFSDEDYRNIRTQYYEPAVSHTTIIATYETPNT